MSSTNYSVSYLAHVRLEQNGEYVIHELVDHLGGVANLAGSYASKFNSQDWAFLAGLWHDLGKFRFQFQQMIKSKSGYDPHIQEITGRVDHSTAGAIYAVEKLGNRGRVLAYLIAGHHAGLADWQSEEAGNGSLQTRLNNRQHLIDTLKATIPDIILEASPPTSQPKGKDPALWIRLLFSALVDADFLDTEIFMDEKKSQNRRQYPLVTDLLTDFNSFMTEKLQNSAPTLVNKLRSEILEQCCQKAQLPSGLFSLTVPTGGGKTLSSLAFALNHAKYHKKDRIIYVIPYTSIIEQTANIFRSIFGENIIEHHCNLDPSQETVKTRLASENWDAPVIITTSVQFFESLFARKTSRTRKLHNIINSVVILDEAQLLPPDFLKPILATINELQKNYNVTFLISTATQPALSSRQVTPKFDGLDNVTEVISDPLTLHKQLKRVELILPKDLHAPCTWSDLATELSTHSSVLCVVHRRDDCRELFSLMPKGTLHLSTFMCGEHRSDIIAEIKSKLKAGIEVKVISTQLVEAGVDIDFPVVYRALAGLDSIAQAAGRCNREGLLPIGKVYVFVPPTLPPKGLLRQAQACGRLMLQENSVDNLSPERFTQYFQQLYWIKGDDLDKHKIIADLKVGNGLAISFATAANKFRLIEDATLPVIVYYKNSDQLIETLRFTGPTRDLMRKLQRYIVNLPIPTHQNLLSKGEIVELKLVSGETVPGIFIQAYEELYNSQIGLRFKDTDWYNAEDLIA